MGASTSKHKTKANKHRSYTAGKPSSPGKPTLKYDPDNLDPDTVTIKWDPPLFDGGSKITGYLVEHKRTGSPYWVKASPQKVRQTQLTVCGLEPGWRYQFRVSAENEIGLSDPSPLSEPLTIFVHRSAAIAPYFVTELHDVAVLENERVEFNATFEGVPTPKISWYKDGLEIFSNRCQKISTEGCFSTFIIYEASTSDESEIKCSATNRVGYAVTKGYLKVEAPPTIRLPRQYEEGLIFEKGELIRLKISVVGQPQPSVNWYLNGEQVTPTSRHEMEYFDKTAVLKVKNAERSDRGEYQIQAINPLGEDVASVLVTIADRPQPPASIVIDKIQVHSVTLSWMPPDDDGGCKIGSYIVEYNKTGWDVWLKAASNRQLTITLDDLIEGSQYRFRVKAENPYGVSDPSSETETVFIPYTKKKIFSQSENLLISENNDSQHIVNVTYDQNKDYLKPSDSEKFSYDRIFGREMQTETECSTENLDCKKLLAPEKPKRKKVKKNLDISEEENLIPNSQLQKAANKNRKQEDAYRDLTPSPQPSTNTDDISRTSSELVLVLVPGNKDVEYREDSVNGVASPFKQNIYQTVPPLLSFSAPELGSEMLFFKPLQRNCVSSTEILHQSTIARLYKELQEENAINKLKTQVDLLPVNKPIEDLSIISINSETDITLQQNLEYAITYENVNHERNYLNTKYGFHSDSSETEASDVNNHDYVTGNLLLPRISETNNISIEKLNFPEKSLSHFQYADLSKYSQQHEEDRPQTRKKSNQLSDITTNVSSSNNTSDTSRFQERYSPLSEPFHYPDLFMESLSKSPTFKTTSTSLPEVVNEVNSRRLLNITLYPAENDLSVQMTMVNSANTSKNTTSNEGKFYCMRQNSFPSNCSLNETSATSSEDLTFENYPSSRYCNENDNSDRDKTASGDEDESSDDEDDEDDTEFEDDTYHLSNDGPLSFEQALAISNPKRRLSPTNDMFLESETMYNYKRANDSYGLHYFNPNYESNDEMQIPLDREQKGDSHFGHTEKQPKSILKSANSEFSRINSSVSILTHANLNFEDQHFGNNQSVKKQVRIEEPEKNFSIKRPDEHDTSQVVINYYSDIVKQFGHVQKPSIKVYLTYDELKAAAQKSEEETENNLLNDQQEESTSAGQEKLSVWEIQQLDGSTEWNSTNNDQSQQTTAAEKAVYRKVHFFFDFLLDLILFTTACWLYCFKDERLAIPIIILMVYRQIYDKVKNKISSFKFWNRRK